MGKTSFTEMPDELDGIVAVLAECDDPTGDEDNRGCGWREARDVNGPVPRLTDDGYIEFGSQLPSRCPECDSPHLMVNGVRLQF